MRPLRFFSPFALSVWFHLSLGVLAGLDFADLFIREDDDPIPTGETTNHAGIDTEVEGKSPEGEASDELVAISVTVIDESAPPPVQAPPPDAVPEGEADVATEAVGANAPTTPDAKAPRPSATSAATTTAGTTARTSATSTRLPHGPPVSATRRTQAGPPCDPPPKEIVQVNANTWSVERALIEFYATHLKELYAQGSVWTHKGADGKADGFKVGLSKCSVVKQAGLRSGDIVTRINDRRISSIPQAIAAYFDLRNEPVLQVYVTRKGQPVMLSYQLGQPDKQARRALTKATRKDMKKELTTTKK